MYTGRCEGWFKFWKYDFQIHFTAGNWNAFENHIFKIRYNSQRTKEYREKKGPQHPPLNLIDGNENKATFRERLKSYSNTVHEKTRSCIKWIQIKQCVMTMCSRGPDQNSPWKVIAQSAPHICEIRNSNMNPIRLCARFYSNTWSFIQSVFAIYHSPKSNN